MDNDKSPQRYNYTQEIVEARLLLERAEVQAVMNPSDEEARHRLKKALRRFKMILENPLGIDKAKS